MIGRIAKYYLIAGQWLTGFYRRWWIALCGLPIAIFILYQLTKTRLPWHFAASLGKPPAIHAEALILVLLGLVCTVTAVCWYRFLRDYSIIVVSISVILSSAGMWLQKDRPSEWSGMDVPTNNYLAALLALDIGPLKLIDTWNARGNPYADSSEIPHADELIGRIKKYKLDWIIGDRWRIRNLPQDNNRMHQHPPGYPLALAAWLSMFGHSRTAAGLFELFLKVLCVVFAAWWIWRRTAENAALDRLCALVLFATAPPVILFFEPHANELATFFAMSALMMIGDGHHRGRIALAVAAGVLLALAAYTNFFYMLFLAVALVIMVFSRDTRRSFLAAGILGGALLVIAAFAIAGYYPWLTYLTGNQVTHYYRLESPLDLPSSMLDFLYFGFPLLLFGLLAFFKLTALGGRVVRCCMVSVLIAFILGAWQSFALGATSRYLMGMFFLMMPLICASVTGVKFNLRQVLMIPVAGYLFIMAAVFL